MRSSVFHLKTVKQTCHSQARWKSSLCVSHFSSSTLESSPSGFHPPKTTLPSQCHRWPLLSLIVCHFISLSAAFDIVIHSSLLEILVSLGLYDPHLYDFSLSGFQFSVLFVDLPSFPRPRIGSIPGLCFPFNIYTHSLIDLIQSHDFRLMSMPMSLIAISSLHTGTLPRAPGPCSASLDCRIGSQTQHVQNGALDLSYPSTSKS